MKTVHAVYEGGVFRPTEQVDLPERCEVEFEPRVLDEPAQHGNGMAGVYNVLRRRHDDCPPDLAARHNEHLP